MNIKLTAALLVATVALPGCRGDGADGAATSAADSVAVADSTGAPAPAPDPEAEARSRVLLEERLAEIEAALRVRPGLIRSIRQDMRRHLNPAHVAAAGRNGPGPVRDSAHLAALVRSGALVRLQDSTQWWVLRDLNLSMPYVTPGTQAALEELGRPLPLGQFQLS